MHLTALEVDLEARGAGHEALGTGVGEVRLEAARAARHRSAALLTEHLAARALRGQMLLHVAPLHLRAAPVRARRLHLHATPQTNVSVR